MSKNVLVIDVPMTKDGVHLCGCCPLWSKALCTCYYDLQTENKGCPLKPMPERCGAKRKDDEVSRLIASGWNACIDYLEGKDE